MKINQRHKQIILELAKQEYQKQWIYMFNLGQRNSYSSFEKSHHETAETIDDLENIITWCVGEERTKEILAKIRL